MLIYGANDISIFLSGLVTAALRSIAGLVRGRRMTSFENGLN